jgi:hypothetical protein
MRTIGAISDTHGLLRPQAVAALAGCDPIIHAGDVGSPEVLARLGALTHAPRRARKRRSGRLEREPTCDAADRDRWLSHYVLDILAELDPQAADNVDAVIYGHLHQPKIETKNGTLFFNPGSAGPRRFRLPITVGPRSMASCAPKSLSSASSVDIGSARTTTDVTPERVRQCVHSRMTATPHLFGFDIICECDGLAEADEHVRTARRYIYEQERLIERLADEGQNTDDAFGLLNLLNRSLRLFQHYRVFLDRVNSLQR